MAHPGDGHVILDQEEQPHTTALEGGSRIVHDNNMCSIYQNFNKTSKVYFILENSPKKIRALIGEKSCLYNSMETQN